MLCTMALHTCTCATQAISYACRCTHRFSHCTLSAFPFSIVCSDFFFWAPTRRRRTLFKFTIILSAKHHFYLLYARSSVFIRVNFGNDARPRCINAGKHTAERCISLHTRKNPLFALHTVLMHMILSSMHTYRFALAPFNG